MRAGPVACRAGFDDAAEVLLEIHAGEGGRGSRLFAADLLAIYARYCQLQRLTAEVVSEDSPLALLVQGKGAARCLLPEVGQHVMQWVPPGEGKRQTSLAAVMVLPLPKVTAARLLPESELTWKAQTAGGPGGQHRNKSATAVRMTHVPTGLSTYIDGRSQNQNYERARRILSARVAEASADRARTDRDSVRQSQWTGGDRGGKRRTYNLYDGRVHDHVTNVTTRDVKSVFKGRLELLAAAAPEPPPTAA